MDQAITPEQSFPVTPAVFVSIDFQNQRPQFRRMVLRGALLELITIGFYRFWLATNIRRHIWHGTSVGGDALEYTGTGWELFLGFVFAVVILGPIYLAYFLIGLEAEHYQRFASVPFGLFFYLFYQFAIFRARRYRMSRTIWRGVRFWMTGSGWNYAWRSALLMLVVILTAGLFLPWRGAILERFKMRHSHYGDLQGRFEATGWEFFKKGFWLWLIGIVLIVLPVVETTVSNKPSASTLFVLPWVVLIGAPFWYAAFKAIEWRWWISGIRFGDVSFSCETRPRHLFGLYWKVIGWFFVIYLIVIVLAGAIGGIIYASMGPLGSDPEIVQRQMLALVNNWHFLAMIALIYVVALLLMTAVMRIYLIHDLTSRLAAVTAVHNIEAAQNVAARGEAANALGEGFANSLDIVGF